MSHRQSFILIAMLLLVGAEVWTGGKLQRAFSSLTGGSSSTSASGSAAGSSGGSYAGAGAQQTANDGFIAQEPGGHPVGAMPQ